MYSSRLVLPLRFTSQLRSVNRSAVNICIPARFHNSAAPASDACGKGYEDPKSTAQNQVGITSDRKFQQSIAVSRVAGGCGAEINGVDLKNINNTTATAIRQALLDHNVVFFRDQDLNPAEFLSFTSHFGKPVEYPFVSGIEGYSEVIEVLKKETETGLNFGGVWHSDTTYLPEPPMGSVLLAREVPSVGGDTMWSNQYAAYEALSSGLKEMLGQLRCVQSSAKADASKTREDRVKDSGRGVEHMEVFHPVVRTHPETGRKALFSNVAHTTRFEGWSEEESMPLLNFLFGHQIKMEFTCRLRWEPGTIAFWDNRCTLHYPLNDYHGYRRRMHRITLAGDVPR